MDQRIALRPTEERDEDLLFAIYSSTRTDLEATNWSDEQKDAFLRMQFTAQSTHYHSHFADAEFQIVLFDDEPIGRLYIDRTPNLINILDIAVLPEHRSKGIGRRLMQDVLSEACQAGCAVRLHVDASNGVVAQWYRRLGFVDLEKGQLYIHMEWSSKNDSLTSDVAST